MGLNRATVAIFPLYDLAWRRSYAIDTNRLQTFNQLSLFRILASKKLQNFFVTISLVIQTIYSTLTPITWGGESRHESHFSLNILRFFKCLNSHLARKLISLRKFLTITSSTTAGKLTLYSTKDNHLYCILSKTLLTVLLCKGLDRRYTGL